MKLPELDAQRIEDSCDTHVDGSISQFELSMLHCARSIAVSLETIAAILGREFHSITDDQYDAVVMQLKAHSVREVPGD